MNIVLLFVGALVMCDCVTSRRPLPLRLLEPNKYLIKRNFVTGSFHFKNLSHIMEPQPVRRPRLMVMLIEAAGSAKFIEVVRVKLRWVGPELWWDNLQNDAENNRIYELRCELEDENQGILQTFLKLNVDASINGYDENFLVRQPFPLLLRCRMRTVNGAGLFSRWIWTNTVKLYKLGHHKMEGQRRGRRRLFLLRNHRQPPIATYLVFYFLLPILGAQNAQSAEDASANDVAAHGEAALMGQQFVVEKDTPKRASAHERDGAARILSWRGIWLAMSLLGNFFSQPSASHHRRAPVDDSSAGGELEETIADSSQTSFSTTAVSHDHRSLDVRFVLQLRSPHLPGHDHRRSSLLHQQQHLPRWDLLNGRNIGDSALAPGAAVESDKSPPPPPYFFTMHSPAAAVEFS